METTNERWIPLSAEIYNKGIFRDLKVFHVYLHILMNVTHQDYTYKSQKYGDIELKSGEGVFSIRKLKDNPYVKINSTNQIYQIINLLIENKYIEYSPNGSNYLIIKAITNRSEMNKSMEREMEREMEHLNYTNISNLQENVERKMEREMVQEQKDIKQKEGNNIRYKEKIYKKESQTLPEHTMKIDLSFIPDEYKEIYSEWIEYRNEIKKPFKSQKSVEANFKQLLKLSNNNLELANDVITQSIANGWQGLFEVKNFTQRNNSAYNQLPKLTKQEESDRIFEQRMQDPRQREVFEALERKMNPESKIYKIG